MAFKLKDRVFGLLGIDWKIRDSYKDAGGRGFMQRFVETNAEEFDTYTLKLIEDLVDNTLVPNKMLIKFIPYAEQQLGVPYILDDFSLRRKLIKFMFRITRIKSTKLSFELMFRLLGFNVDFYIDTPGSLNQFNLYIVDSPSGTGSAIVNDGSGNINLAWGDRYYVTNSLTTLVSLTGDARLKRETILDIFSRSAGFDNPVATFDYIGRTFDQKCQTCQPYIVRLYNSAPITQELHNAIFRILEFLQPINARLAAVFYNDLLLLADDAISIYINEDGDLVYDNTAVPEVYLTLDEDGNLFINNVQVGQYFIDENGDMNFNN